MIRQTTSGNDDTAVELQTLPRKRSSNIVGKQNTASGRKVSTGVVDTSNSESDTINATNKSGDMSNSTKRKMSSENSKKGLREWLFGTRTSKKSSQKTPKSPNGDKSQFRPDKFTYKRTSSQDFNYSTEDDEDTLKSPKSPLPFQQSRLRGHVFEQHQRPTWCDLCEDFIWGVYRQGVRCQYCRYTCHIRCLLDITLDCPKAPMEERSLKDLTNATLEILSKGKGTPPGNFSKTQLPSYVSSYDELREVILNYNRNSSLIMTLQDDGTFHGFVRVQMHMNRPVNVSSDISSLTMRKAITRSNTKRSRKVSGPSQTMTTSSNKNKETNDDGIVTSTPATMNQAARRRRLSFYLPKGASKPLHVTSTTTVREVIEALLDKYQVTDNPRKFALFERTEEENQIVQRRLSNDEYPLVLSLFWGGNNSIKSFALQEDDTGDDMWFAFEIPELRNFLVILDKEENDMMSQIKTYYTNYKSSLEQILQEKFPDRYESLC